MVLTQRSRKILRWTQRLLFAGAVSMFGYDGFVLVDAWVFQNREDRRLDYMLTNRHSDSTETPGMPATGGMFGRIVIPRLGLSVVVAEGVDNALLRRAAGHIPGTALPGQGGNIGISGHRDTFFRPLRNIRQLDDIVLTTLVGEYHYRVVSTVITSPSDVAVLDPGKNEILTLVTCYPFYFIGPAPKRFIVRAERVNGAS